MNGFEIDCELNYEVLDPCVFVFNIEDVAFATMFGQARMTRMSPLTRVLSTDELNHALQSSRQVVQMLAQAA